MNLRFNKRFEIEKYISVYLLKRKINLVVVLMQREGYNNAWFKHSCKDRNFFFLLFCVKMKCPLLSFV